MGSGSTRGLVTAGRGENVLPAEKYLIWRDQNLGKGRAASEINWMEEEKERHSEKTTRDIKRKKGWLLTPPEKS